ncbi:MAG: hypothetical protein M1824_000266 [Vezdaea acicularis]|nr:MAG: hypothetical protein M1824_000266 [Vezdaea acicularis]
MATAPKYSHELEIASLAVQKAALVTKKVFNEKVKATITKDDKSPVTLGDFAAQAIILHSIHKHFPDDEIAGEEESTDLRKNETLQEQLWELVKDIRLDADAEKILGEPISSVDDILEAIDAGNSSGGAKGRIWTIDPIDGTKGFLRGGQYAICLALMVDGDVKVGVLGCPNLPVDDNSPLDSKAGESQTDGEGKGVLFSAVQGHGATSRPIGRGLLQPEQNISLRPISDVRQATLCESVEALHSKHDDVTKISAKLGIERSVRMDSQAKYGSIARGAADILLRLPTSIAYQEKIWDHAAGYLIVREAGGEISDVFGKNLDFSKGRTLIGNKGVIVAPKAIHKQVLSVVGEVFQMPT